MKTGPGAPQGKTLSVCGCKETGALIRITSRHSKYDSVTFPWGDFSLRRGQYSKRFMNLGPEVALPKYDSLPVPLLIVVLSAFYILGTVFANIAILCKSFPLKIEALTVSMTWSL